MHGIGYEYHENAAVYISQQARELIRPLPGAETKNLFLRDKKGRRLFLLTMNKKKPINLKA